MRLATQPRADPAGWPVDRSTIGAMAQGPDYTGSAVVLGSNGVINLTPTQSQSNLVKDLSDDGSVAVGMASLPPFGLSAFRWTAQGGHAGTCPSRRRPCVQRGRHDHRRRAP